MKILFHIFNFTFRGTEVVCFDYSHFNKVLLNNESIIGIPRVQSQQENKLVKEKFSEHFQIFYYNDLNDLNMICKRENVDAVYTIKYGINDELILKIPTFVHCVFTTEQPHGNVYAGVSDSVSKKNNHNKIYPVVNHMVYLPDIKSNYRKELNIPENALVFGRHGGDDTFNIFFVKEAILEVLNERKDIYFIFAVKPKMLNDIIHDNIIYLDSFVDMRIKTKFINTCDSMIHASSLGESFGLSILEFSHQNKPVITFRGNGQEWHTQHLSNLGNKAILYNDKNELVHILKNFIPEEYKRINYKSICDPFTPKKIMGQFQKVFLDSIK